jgi:hypothetical protein
MMRGIGQLVPGVFFVLVPQAVAVQMRGMRAVARACRKADADRAAAEYQKLMKGIGEIVYGVFDERGLLMPADGAGSARARPS